MLLSVVSTLYKSAPYLDEFHKRISAAAAGITGDYEIILVNDGCPEGSLEKALFLHNKDSKVRVIDLSRNFGHHRAMMTGLAHARGDWIFLIDCDLEEDPEWLVLFHRTLLQTGADVVYGVQESRKGGLFERLTGWVFFALFNALSLDPVPHNVLVVRLMTSRYVSALVRHQEREIMIAGLWTITGFDQRSIAVRKKHKGATTYTFPRKVATLVNAVAAFSNKPLAAIFYFGVLIVFLSAAAAAYLIVQRIFFSVMLEGWPSLMVTICLLGGLIVFCQGVIGIYLSKIYTEVKRRPYVIVRKMYERDIDKG